MPKSKKTRQKQKPTAQATAQPTRRNAMRLAGGLAIGGIALAAGGVWAAGWVQDTRDMHDLSRIGKGRLSVVQIHDPGCALCLQLQRNTKKAMGSFDDGAMDYLIANIKSDDGAMFAAGHDVQHVTLLLMNKAGRVVDVVQGVHSTEELEAILSRFVENT